MNNLVKANEYADQPSTVIYAINAYSNVLVEVATNTLNLADVEVQNLLHDMHRHVTEALNTQGINYVDLRWALTPRPSRHEIAFIFDVSKSTNALYGEEFSKIWLKAMSAAGGPKRTAILEGDIIGSQPDAVWQVMDEQLGLNGEVDTSGQYFVVYLTNISNAQLVVLDYEMRTNSAAYLGYVDCSCWNSFKTALMLPQVALRVDDQIITVEDDDGYTNLRGYPFEDFGFHIVGVDEVLYGTMLEFRIDIGASQWLTKILRCLLEPYRVLCVTFQVWTLC